MIRETLKKSQLGCHLTRTESFETFREIMGGEITDPVLIGALLTALQMNGPSVDEITGAAQAMRRASVHIHAPENAVDIVGTGGDGCGTFNCSTTAAFIAAGAGVTIVKHGNRASTSKCGAADCLAALGYNLQLGFEGVERSIQKNDIGFCFANLCHPAMRYAAPIRKVLPFRTIFNLLGPLTNPAGVTRCALGVYAPEIIPLYIGALKLLNTKRALVFCGPDNLDELGLAGPSHVAEIHEDGAVTNYIFDPKSVFGAYYPITAIAGGTPEENAQLTQRILSGVERGPYRFVSVLNAAAAIVAGGLAETLTDGLALATRALDSGAAYAKLKALISDSNNYPNVA